MKSGAINLRGDSAGEQDEGLDAAVAGPAYKSQVREGGPIIHSASTGYCNCENFFEKWISHEKSLANSICLFLKYIYAYIFF